MTDPTAAPAESDEPISPEEADTDTPPDARQPAYDAVYAHIRALGDQMPPDPVHRNAMIWQAVHAALTATPVGRCVSSHCVEGDHVLIVEEPHAAADPAPAEDSDQRHTVDTITGDALNALYESLDAAEATESQRQLATAREALASATTRAAQLQAALDRVRAVADSLADGTEAGFRAALAVREAIAPQQ